MRILVPACQTCKERNIITSDSSYQWVSIVEGGVYEYECLNGHSTILNHQAHKFQVLFEIACQAIVDGYYRDAIASFSSSLERFYEFYVEAILIKNELYDSNIAQIKKMNSNSSEREYGAFSLVYLLEERSVPHDVERMKTKDLDNKEFKSFRNNVIHKGHIPSRINAMCFGQIVLDFIIPVLLSISKKEYAQDTLHNTMFSKNAQKLWKVVEERKRVKKYDNISGGSLPMLLGPVPHELEEKKKLSDYISYLYVQRTS